MKLFDLHCDTLYECCETGKHLRENDLHVNRTAAQRYEHYVQFFALFCGAYPPESQKKKRSCLLDTPKDERLARMLQTAQTEFAANADWLTLCRSGEELTRAAESGKAAAFLSIEGAELLPEREGALDEAYDAGVRLVTLTWNYRSRFGCPSAIDQNEGLTDGGRQLVRALDGQAVFYSHYTNEAFLSRAAMPVMSSGKTVGAVYVCESDSERAALIGSIQRRLATITIGIGAAALVVLWFSIKMLTRRITQLADGVRTVQRGDYSFRLTLAGDDELTELGREFNNLTERLETTEAQRRRFVSDASHELKTPLASIRLLSDSISQSADMDSETMREFVTDIGSEAERLQRTTEKLLDLSRRDDGVQPDVTIVDLQQAVHGTLHLLRPLADQSGVTITCLMSEGVTVRASEDDIYHIVFNLVENAIKYNLPGGDVTVRVETHGGQSVLSVADTGIGIPEADRPNIFNRFYRVDKARSREHGGSGLGLSIVHDAAALYGGTVAVDGVEPHGTRFTVTFPRAKADNAPEAQKEVPET